MRPTLAIGCLFSLVVLVLMLVGAAHLFFVYLGWVAA